MKSLLAHLLKSASIFIPLNKSFLTFDEKVSGYFYYCLTMSVFYGFLAFGIPITTNFYQAPTL